MAMVGPQVSFSSELGACDFGDTRLVSRQISLAEHLSERPLAHIPEACRGAAEVKAAYRFFHNPRVQPERILSPHRQATTSRMQDFRRVLVASDTSSINYAFHPATRELGPINGKFKEKKDSASRGLLMHTSLALSLTGVPLGIIEQKIWARGFLSKQQLYSSEFTLQESENNKWLYGLQQIKALQASLPNTQIIAVSDREADCGAYLYYCQENKISFVQRARSDRILGNAYKRRIVDHLEALAAAGEFKLDVREKERTPAGQTITTGYRKALMKVYFAKVFINLRDSRGEDIAVNAVYVKEAQSSGKKKDVNWLLLTDLHIESFENALEVIEIYKQRWQIEIFHKVLKSGYKVEDCRLGSADSLTNYLTLMSIICWRIMMLMKLGQDQPALPCTLVLTENEWRTLYMKTNPKQKVPQAPPSLQEATIWIARLGGYLARRRDPPPGPTLLWRGWNRLQAMVDFYETCVMQ